MAVFFIIAGLLLMIWGMYMFFKAIGRLFQNRNSYKYLHRLERKREKQYQKYLKWLAKKYPDDPPIDRETYVSLNKRQQYQQRKIKHLQN